MQFRRLSDRECDDTRQNLQKARAFYRQGEYVEAQFKIQKSLGVLKKKVGEIPTLSLRRYAKGIYSHIKDCYLLSASCHTRLS